MEKIFLTGITGLVGSAFVVALLRERQDYEIVCLARKTAVKSAQQRTEEIIRDECRFDGCPELADRILKSVKVIEGDVTSINPEELAKNPLLAGTTIIFHCAADVNLGKDPTGRTYRINYNGTATITGGLVKVDGALMVTRGGTLKIADDVALTAVTDADDDDKLDGAIYVGIKGNTTANYENTTLSTLELSSAKLSQFLNSDKETITDGDQTVADGLGQVSVGLGGRIHFTDQNQVEVSQFAFNNTAGAGHIGVEGIDNSSSNLQDDTAIEQHFKVGEDDNAMDGTRSIVASNMSIGKSLIAVSEDTATTGWEHVKSGNASYAFRFEANDMTLGSEKGTLNDDSNWNGFDSKDQIGAHELKAHKSITFIDGRSDTFYLQDDVVLDTTLGSDTVLGSADSSNTGTLKGDDVVIGYDNGTSSTSGSLSVTGGAWSTTQGQSITVADGSLSAYHDGEMFEHNLVLKPCFDQLNQALDCAYAHHFHQPNISACPAGYLLRAK